MKIFMMKWLNTHNEFYTAGCLSIFNLCLFIILTNVKKSFNNNIFLRASHRTF